MNALVQSSIVPLSPLSFNVSNDRVCVISKWGECLPVYEDVAEVLDSVVDVVPSSLLHCKQIFKTAVARKLFSRHNSQPNAILQLRSHNIRIVDASLALAKFTRFYSGVGVGWVELPQRDMGGTPTIVGDFRFKS